MEAPEGEETRLERAPAPRGGAGNLAAAELAGRLPPGRRAGDPLGLGLARPPPPPDPDAYSAERERREFVRSLLPPAELEEVEAEVGRRGFLTIEEVRGYAETSGAGGLDAELIALLDTRVDYKLFVVGDNVYRREELYAAYPFAELGTQPEAVFSQQELCVFPAKATSLDGGLEYLVRDAGDLDREFVTAEDLVAAAVRGAPARRPPLRTALTKVYLGKEDWKDFLQLCRVQRAAARAARARGVAPAALAAAFAPGGRPALEDAAEGRAAAAEAARAEAEAARARAEEARALAEKRAALLEEDLRRIEARLAEDRRAAAAPPAG